MIMAIVMPLRLLGRTVVIALMITTSQVFAMLGGIDGFRPVFLLFLFFCSVHAALARFLWFWHDVLRNENSGLPKSSIPFFLQYC